MDDAKRVVVLISTYNGEKYISEQIESILKQKTKQHVDIVIRDDGSKDKTVTVVSKIAEKNTCIKIIKGENIGVVCSFFDLLKQAGDYDYYSFCDQDDYWLEDKIETAVNTLGKVGEDISLLYASPSFVADGELHKTGKITQTERKKIDFYNTAIQNFCPGHNQVFNFKLAEILRSVDVDPTQVYSQDLWVTNVAVVTGRIIFDKTPHTLYRMHQNNELGFGEGRADWIKQRILRAQGHEGAKFSRQLKYFYHIFKDQLTDEQQDEVRKFLSSQSSFVKRAGYISKTKFWRQRDKENVLFKLLYLFGGYKF